MDPVTAALVHEFSADQDLDYLGEDKQFEHFAAYSVISSVTAQPGSRMERPDRVWRMA
jgi:hypothetical protein